MNVNINHAAPVQAAIWVEVFSTLWMVVEGAVAIGAGVAASSALLMAFGIDSVIELISGVFLLWRLSVEMRGESASLVERAERRAAWLVTICLALLCLYVLVTAVYGLVMGITGTTGTHLESAPTGILISAAAFLIMPVLGLAKRRLATRIGRGALRGDAASSFTCFYMAGTVLLGVGLNALFHWWWAEDVAALLFLFWLVRETREALDEARE